MKENKRLLIVAGIMLLLVVLGVVGYFTWINIAFVDTLHAQVWAREADIRSIAPGRVSSLLVSEGDSVAPGVCIQAQVNEARVAQVQVGQSVRVRIKQRAVKRTHWGWVSQVGARTEASVGSGLGGGGAIEVPVRIDLPAEAIGLTPGMSADVRISVTPRIW